MSDEARLVGRIQTRHDPQTDNAPEINDVPSYEEVVEVPPAPATRGFFKNEAEAARALSIARRHEPSEESMSKATEARLALAEHLLWADAEYADRAHDEETAARYVLAVADGYGMHIDNLDPVEDRETIEGGHQILKVVNPDYQPKEQM
jgi:hypothetical protein